MSALMHELKPWLRSTGPVTVEGKKRASLNGNASKLKRDAEPQGHATAPAESVKSHVESPLGDSTGNDR